MSSLTIIGLLFTSFMVLLAIFAHVGRKLHEEKYSEHNETVI